jgi:hypothetical protein
MWEGRTQYSAFARRALKAIRNRVYDKTGVRFEFPLSTKPLGPPS